MTPHQRKLYDFVAGYWRDHGVGPSYRQIQRGLGSKSTGPIVARVKRMVDEGFLVTTPGVARSIRPSEKPLAEIIEMNFAAKGKEVAENAEVSVGGFGMKSSLK